MEGPPVVSVTVDEDVVVDVQGPVEGPRRVSSSVSGVPPDIAFVIDPVGSSSWTGSLWVLIVVIREVAPPTLELLWRLVFIPKVGFNSKLAHKSCKTSSYLQIAESIGF